ncbi:alpha/beta fold hydrolase [Kribbella sp. NPDC049227]|uniref:alpha/beta fold hydrolase n=1 Tax=Kribbella sp. NPDC049227 TaxID=3364113 RepID=UPI003714C692
MFSTAVLPRPRLGLFVAVLLAAGVLVMPSARSATAHSELQWGACPDDLAGPFPSLVCTTMTVPLDYAHPHGRSIQLVVSKHLATDPARRRGVLFVDNGGPGGSAAMYAGALSTPNVNGYTRLSADVLATYDVIGMDPRGVVHSTPLHCAAPDYFKPPQPDPDDPAMRDELWSIWHGYAQQCEQSAGWLLPYVGTVNVARDMDRLRAALGESKISYFGVSYGSYLGAAYGQLFPKRVDRMIVDALLDFTPEHLWYEVAHTQAQGLQQRLDSTHDWSFFNWIARYDSVFHLGNQDQVRASFNRLLADWRAHPHGAVGASELLGLMYPVMFSEALWIPVAQALSAAVHGDDSQLVAFATPGLDAASEQGVAISNAVECVDDSWPHLRSRWEADTAREAQTSQFAWWLMFSESVCQDWPAPQHDALHITGRGMPRILMFNSVGDPATVYSGALNVHRRLSNSVLVTERNAGKHVVFANTEAAANTEANAIGSRYLVAGSLPAHDVSVGPHPLPVPAAAAVSATTALRQLTDER